MTKKRATRKRSSSSKPKTSPRNKKIEDSLIKNMIELQKIQTNMAEQFEKLSRDISQLLALFELTARNFAKKSAPIGEIEKDKEFLDKIDTLLEQNKILAKGLTLMEERLRERMFGEDEEITEPIHEPRRVPAGETFRPSIAAGSRPLPKF